jgi:hypothetical protein
MLFFVRKASGFERKEDLLYRVIAPPTEGMATYNATDRKKCAPPDTMALNRLKSIIGAGRNKTAARWKQRGKNILIAPDQTKKKCLRYLADFRLKFHLISLLPWGRKETA